MAKRPSPAVTTALSATFDVAALASTIAGAVQEATLNGGASGRATIEVMGAQLKAAYERCAYLEGEQLKYLGLVGRAAAATAHTDVLLAQERILTAELATRNDIIEKGFKILPEVASFLKDHLIGLGGPRKLTAAAAADSGEKSGRAAFLRLFGAIADKPDLLATLRTLAGDDDWMLILTYAQELSEST